MKIPGNFKSHYQWEIVLCLCLPFVLTACVNHFSEEEGYGNDEKIPLKFIADISAPSNIRMQNNAFEEGDEVGVFALTNSSTLREERYVDNMKFKRSAKGEFCPEEIVYFPDDGSALDLISYYPYKEAGIKVGESVMKVSVEADQTVASNYAYSDFLVATSKNQHATKETLSLSYNHKLFRLNIAIVPGEGESLEDLYSANPQISVNGFYADAMYNFQEDLFGDYSAECSILPAGTWEMQEGRLVGKNAILIPQEVVTGYQYVSLKVNGKVYRCVIPENLNLQSGKQGELEITFVAVEDVLLGSVKGEINDWEEGDKVETGSQALRGYVDVSLLDFEVSNVYKIVSEERQVAEICKEYIVSSDIATQAIVAYPMKNGRTDLTKGTVVQLIGQSGKVHGGQISWSDEGVSYVPGTMNARKYVYVLLDGQISLAAPVTDESLSLLPIADVMHDRRGETESQYPIVKIGTQYWMRDNLKTALYTDGTGIPKLSDIDENVTGYLLSESGNYFYTPNVITSNLLVPEGEGWKMPTWDDWNLLKAYVREDASLLKAGIWKPIEDQPSEKATNMSGFNAQPVGMWWVGGEFANYEGKYVGYWTLDSAGNLAEKSCMLSSTSNEIREGTVENDRACSIRLLRK